MELVRIADFDKGIGASPHTGFADMRGLDVVSEPGVAQLNLQLFQQSATAKSTTFTADAGTDVITIASGNFYNNPNLTSSEGRAVTVSSSGTLPAGLAAATTYFLIGVTATTYKLATTLANAIAGTAIDITDAGSGTHTITSVNIGDIKFFAKDSRTGNVYAQDANGKVWSYGDTSSGWVLITGNGTANANAQGLAVWKNYLFAFRSAKIDVYGPLTSALGSRAWTNDWQTLTASTGETNDHYAFVSNIDDKLYFADRNSTSGTPYIGSITQLTTFDPATGSTYTYNATALDLPAYKTITCLEDLGSNLMAGTVGREIFPWDRTSTSFSNPIIATEDGINCMRTLNNVLYFSAGTRGNIYGTVGSSTTLIREFPAHLSGTPFKTITIGAMTGHKGRLFFTIYSSSNTCSGVWSLDVRNGRLVCENRFSLETYTATSSKALYSLGSETYIVSWTGGGVSGIDSILHGVSSSYYQTGYGAYFESALYEVGTEIQKKDFRSIEHLLTKALATGHGIQLYYRTNSSDSYSLIGTFDSTTPGTKQSHFKLGPKIPRCTMVQIKCELTTGSTSTTTPKLKSVTLR